ncbi:MAG TPA: hypothetical protein VFZ78_05020 [Flavisolibacter sp.]
MGRVFFAVTMVVVLLSCAGSRVSSDNSIPPAPSGILFLAYELKRDSITNEVSARLLHQLRAEGSVEPQGTSASPRQAGDVIISLQDSRRQVVDEFRFPDPFLKHYEGVNDQGQLGHHEVRENRAEVLVRLNLMTNMTQVSVSLARPDSKSTVLLTHPLNPEKN